jgi:hypothetical protein
VKAILLSVALFAMASAAWAAECAPREVVVDQLTSKYGETRQSAALDQQNRLVEMFANLDTGSWTALATSPSGRSCVVSYGHSYEPITEAPGDPA